MIPVIGQPGTQLGWWPMAIYQCNCKSPNPGPTLVLSGAGNPSICPNCGLAYVIAGMGVEEKTKTVIPIVNVYKPVQKE